MKFVLSIALLLGLGACQQSESPEGYDALEQYVGSHRVGSDADQWIEMKGRSGAWEKTGLIFQYSDDNEECQKAIAGMKKVNYLREYRCTPAN